MLPAEYKKITICKKESDGLIIWLNKRLRLLTCLLIILLISALFYLAMNSAKIQRVVCCTKRRRPGMIQFQVLIRYVLLIAALSLLGYRITSIVRKHYFSSTQSISDQKNDVVIQSDQAWMTVFIHGSFGSTLGLLSIPRVLDDNVRGSSYREVSRRLREDDLFFSEQPVLGRGLTRISPSFNLQATKGKKYSAYPLIKAYDVIDEHLSPERGEQFFYTFGWTGLMSQNSRRYEAIRLYNALVKELLRLKEQGKNPKIRLVTHSHGGNLSLNLAAISTVLSLKSFNHEQKFSEDEDTDRSIRAMLEIIKGLPSRANMPPKTGQKVLDYVPESKNLVIDELILFGAPIQPETQGFCSFPIFKKIFNFYSGEDFIQRFDWVSTRRYFSDQRLSHERFSSSKDGQMEFPQIIQARIMIGRQWSKRPGIITQEMDKKLTTTNHISAPASSSWWQKMFFGKKSVERTSADPTHKEFWFISWPDYSSGSQHQVGLLPLPIMILTPMFLKLLEPFKQMHDIDINIRLNNKFVKASLADHEQTIIRAEQKIPRNLIEMIKVHLNSWKPALKTKKEEFDSIYKHVVD
jgi:hypothetical protein